jgi:hypothetical protein
VGDGGCNVGGIYACILKILMIYNEDGEKYWGRGM